MADECFGRLQGRGRGRRLQVVGEGVRDSVGQGYSQSVRRLTADAFLLYSNHKA